MESRSSKCPFCQSKMEYTPNEAHTYYICVCPTCGRYARKVYPEKAMENLLDETAAFLYYTGNPRIHKEDSHISVIGDRAYYESKYSDRAEARYVSEEEIRAFYPKTFAERISRILLGFAQQAGYFGNIILLNRNELLSALFIKRMGNHKELLSNEEIDRQFNAIKEYLEEKKYIDLAYSDHDACILLKVDGWKRIDELQVSEEHNKNVFVSMSFSDNTKETREAIRAGIIKSGYSPEFIDETIHNQQIVPEMFRMIRESRFLILEISDPNYGAYYEAGYALGLGKEVIITCSKEVFTKQYTSKEDKKYERYMKPHFDIAQKQILVWDDYEDLTKKLSEWIKAIIG